MKARVAEIYDLLNIVSPFELQESWDNSGLNIGSLTAKIKKIYSCLEVTIQIADEVLPNSLIIAHHPLIFKSIKNFNYQNYPANIAKILIEKSCSLICMHTNFDATHLNAYFSHDVLGFENLKPDGIALSGHIKPISLKVLGQQIQQKLSLKTLRYVQAVKTIKNIYVVCGAGVAYIHSKVLPQNSCLITGDIKYHDAMIAKSLKISLIEVEHHSSEKFFARIIQNILKNKGYEVIIKDFKSPFEYI